MKRNVVIAALVVVILGALGTLFVRGMSSLGAGETSASAAPAPLTTGKGVVIKLSDRPMTLPAFDIKDVDGQPLARDSWKDKVVLINFWATWCGPCREEIPTLVALQAHYKDKVVVIGLSVDDRPAAEVRDFAKQFSVNYPIAIAPDAVQQQFGGISAVPATFVVSPKDGIVTRHVGELNPQVTEQEIRYLAGMQTDATVERVKDTGQLLLANAAYATEIPGVDLSKLTPAQKELALQRMNTEHCTCGCNLTIAQCRINDPSCDVSLPIAQKIVKDCATASP